MAKRSPKEPCQVIASLADADARTACSVEYGMPSLAESHARGALARVKSTDDFAYSTSSTPEIIIPMAQPYFTLPVFSGV